MFLMKMQDVWREITANYLDQLIESMRDRMAAMIANRYTLLRTFSDIL